MSDNQRRKRRENLYRTAAPREVAWMKELGSSFPKGWNDEYPTGTSHRRGERPPQRCRVRTEVVDNPISVEHVPYREGEQLIVDDGPGPDFTTRKQVADF